MTASDYWRDWSCGIRLAVTDDAVLAQARRHLSELMGDVERAASRFLPTSDVGLVNAAAGQLVPVSRRTVALVDVALDAAADTSGLVDPTVGRHLVAAGYDGDIESVRARLVITDDTVRPRRADWRSVQVDHDLARVGVPRGLALDLGATAKAWTADAAAHAIAATFGTGVLVELGGDIAVAGSGSRPWQVLVSERAGESGEQVGLSHGGITTSSASVRSWRTSAGTAHHIIDPRTGAPADGPWRTVTVWAHSAVEANTASTAAIILGAAATSFLDERGHAARLVHRDGHVETVGAWPVARRTAS